MAEPIDPPAPTAPPVNDAPAAVARPGGAGSPTGAGAAAGFGLSDDWPKQATDAVVKLVDSVREKTTGPAVNAAHALKYGIVAALLLSVLGIIVLIGAMRLSEAVLQKIGSTFDITWLAEPMWIVYLFYGALLSLAGMWLWRKANQPARPGA